MYYFVHSIFEGRRKHLKLAECACVCYIFQSGVNVCVGVRIKLPARTLFMSINKETQAANKNLCTTMYRCVNICGCLQAYMGIHVGVCIFMYSIYDHNI